MSLFSDWNNDTVTVQRIGEADGFGGRQPIGDPFPLQVDLRETSVRLRGADGQETLSTARLYTDLGELAQSVTPADQITLPDGRVTSVLTVTVVDEDTELDGVTVTCE